MINFGVLVAAVAAGTTFGLGRADNPAPGASTAFTANQTLLDEVIRSGSTLSQALINATSTIKAQASTITALNSQLKQSSGEKDKTITQLNGEISALRSSCEETIGSYENAIRNHIEFVNKTTSEFEVGLTTQEPENPTGDGSEL